MTLNEFRAWLSGFTDSMVGAPTDSQWVKIKKRLLEIDEVPTPKTIFVDKYYPSWPNTFLTGTNCISNSTVHPAALPHNTIVASASNAQLTNFASEGAMGVCTPNYEIQSSFDSLQAFLELGKSEYEGIKKAA